MAFTVADLQYEYIWTASKEHDNAAMVGFPDNVPLDREEGYEVIYFINRFMHRYDLVTLDSFKKIENIIRNHLPEEVRGSTNVRDWVLKNWESC